MPIKEKGWKFKFKNFDRFNIFFSDSTLVIIPLHGEGKKMSHICQT